MCIELVANRFLRRVIILLNVLDARFFFSLELLFCLFLVSICSCNMSTTKPIGLPLNSCQI